MMLLLDALVLSTVAALVTGGRLRRLGSVELRGEGMLLAVLVFQLVVVRLPLGGVVPELVLVYGAWVMPGLILVSILALNHRSPGLRIALVGVALNIVVVALNAGMPVQAASMASVPASFASYLDSSWLHVPVDPATRFTILADILPVPGPAWHRGLVSLGDVLLVAGVGYFVFSSMHASDSRCLETG